MPVSPSAGASKEGSKRRSSSGIVASTIDEPVMADYFRGKVYAISGCASSVGVTVAKQLAAQGANLSIADINEKALMRVKDEIEKMQLRICGGFLVASVVDVRDDEQVEEWMQATLDEFSGRLDGTVNLTDMTGDDDVLADMDSIGWELVMGVNVTGMMKCMKAQIPHLKEGGSIVNASGVSAKAEVPQNAAFAAARGSLIALSRCATRELSSKGVRVNVIVPGSDDTSLMNMGPLKAALPETGPKKRPERREEVANLIEFLLSEKSSCLTGAVLNVDGW